MARLPLSHQRLADAKLRLLQMHYEAGVGHIGGCLSVLDVLMILHHEAMSEDDAFVLSKGHAAGALYVTLQTLGLLDDEELKTFHRDGTRLSGHPPCSGLPSIPFATGSLGHGPGLAAGMALARRLQRRPGRVFCVTSDGEWNEGSCWEAVIFARHHRLANLTLVVDLNGLQGFGTTKEVADLAPLSDKFRAFGWRTVEVEGHDLDAVRGALAPSPDADVPSVVVARTRKGCGVSFMEGEMAWHYLPMSAALYAQAADEIRRCADVRGGGGASVAGAAEAGE